MSKRAKPLTIVVVGAGIAGLSAAIGLTRAGHRVIVLDRNPSTYDGGAGILLPRNTIRVLDHWGLQKEFLEVVDVVEHNEVRTHNEGALIRRQYGVGFPGSGDRCFGWFVRRAAAQNLLCKIAGRQGAELRFRAKVASINESLPSVTLEDGSTIDCDLVIGADGIQSRTRQKVCPNIPSEVQPGVVFQISVPRASLERDPETRALFQQRPPTFYLWTGPGRFVTGWATDTEYDCQWCDEDYGAIDSTRPWNEPGDIDELRARFKDFKAPFLQAFLANGENCRRWRLAEVPNLPTWATPDGKIVLLGDAAHAMGPYAGQGAAQGIEDAAVLSTLLSHSAVSSDLPEVARLYQSLRKARAERVHKIARSYRLTFSLPPGKEKEKRDKLLLQASQDLGDQNEPRRLPGEKWLDEHDAVAEAEKVLRQYETISTPLEAKL